MGHARLGLRVLGLAFLAALGLMTFGAVGAQATGDWTILGTSIAAEETFSGKVDTENVISAPKWNIEIKCPVIDITEGKLLPLDGGVSLGHFRFLFLECKVFSLSPLQELTKCTIENKDITAFVNLEVLRDKNNKTYLLAKPSVLPAFGTVVFTGACALPEKLELKGSIVFELLAAEAVEQLMKPAPEAVQSEFGDGLKLGSNSATLSGSWLLKLTGAKAGEKWGAV